MENFCPSPFRNYSLKFFCGGGEGKEINNFTGKEDRKSLCSLAKSYKPLSITRTIL